MAADDGDDRGHGSRAGNRVPRPRRHLPLCLDQQREHGPARGMGHGRRGRAADKRPHDPLLRHVLGHDVLQLCRDPLCLLLLRRVRRGRHRQAGATPPFFIGFL